jgi:mono/diheme cytochrome c family protein
MNERRRAGVRDTLKEKLGAEYDAALPAATGAEIEQGAKIYGTLCRRCHGRTGQGEGRSARALSLPPPSLADPETASFFSDQAKLEIIANGSYGTPMVGWSEMLNKEERLAVLHFVKTLGENPVEEAP